VRLVIGEYIRTLRERDELDRLLPDLLSAMGYVLIARPQTGNRQYGVDLAARGKDSLGTEELILVVVKQGDIGRTEWENGAQSVRASINEIFDVYLGSHVEPEDKNRRIKIVLATNGDLKQTVLPNWSGFVKDHSSKAVIEFWGIDKLAELVEQNLLDEHVFRDDNRKQLRRALALSGDSEYDQSDLHELYLNCLGLESDGTLQADKKSTKELLKALRAVNFSAQIYSSWSSKDGDARQGLRAMERAVLWSWHRLQLEIEGALTDPVREVFSAIWFGYLNVGTRYFEKLQRHLVIEDGLSGYSSNGAEFSLVAFEQIGILALIGLSLLSIQKVGETESDLIARDVQIVVAGLASAIDKNGICDSPCLDRHCSDITLALCLLVGAGYAEDAKKWLVRLVGNIHYAYTSKQYVPIATDSIDDLVEDSGWNGGPAGPTKTAMSWMLPTLAGWCIVLGMDEEYRVLANGAANSYPEVCLQLWHPDANLYNFLYFKSAHFSCGASEAPIKLPEAAIEWRTYMSKILASDQSAISIASTALSAGFGAIDLIAFRHFKTPIPPYFWYQFLKLNALSEDA
jgi:hypothetical protein